MFDLLILARYNRFQIRDIFLEFGEHQGFLRDVRVYLIDVLDFGVNLSLEAFL